MHHLFLSALLVSTLCHVQAGNDPVIIPSPPTEHDEAAMAPKPEPEPFILAAYPWKPSPTKSEHTKITTTPLAKFRETNLYIHPHDNLSTLDIRFLKNPIVFDTEDVEWIVYNQTKQLVVANATAQGHEAISHWLIDKREPERYSLSFEIFFVDYHTALEVTDGFNPSEKLEGSPVIAVSGITKQSGGIPLLEAKSDELSLKVVLLAGQRFTDIYTNEFFFQLEFLELKKRINVESKAWFDTRHPTVIALGPHPDDAAQTIIVRIHIHRCAPNGQIMMNGRLCKSLEDHEKLRFGSLFGIFKFQGADGKPVYAKRIDDPDRLTLSEPAADPFAADNVKDPFSKPAKPASTPGMHGSEKMITAEPLLSSRGVSFKSDTDWAAFHEESCTLFFRTTPINVELISVLLDGHGCWLLLPTIHRISIADESSPSEKPQRSLYVFPARAGDPVEFSLYDIETDSILTDLTFDFQTNYETKEMKSIFNLRSTRFEALKDGNTFEAALMPDESKSFKIENTTICLTSMIPEEYRISVNKERAELVTDPFRTIDKDGGN